MKKFTTTILIAGFLMTWSHKIWSQCVATCEFVDGRWVIAGDGGPCPCPISTAVPFLRINPDARAGGMGDAGIATTADAASLAFNDSKIMFAEQDFSLALGYVPWLRAIGVNDIGLTYASGFRKLDDVQAIGASLRYFTLGTIDFTDIENNPLGTGKPNEFEIKIAYARKLTDKLSAAIAPKFIFSDLASGQFTVDNQSEPIRAGIAFAADLSLTYVNTVETTFKRDFTLGVALSNIGNKIAYTSFISDMLPANLGIGVGWKAHLDEFNTLAFVLDANKLLVPSPLPLAHPDYDVNPQDGIADFRQKSVFESIFGSFTDAPGGFREELREINYSLGMEYWYDKQFAFRLGYFYEHFLKGNRRFITAGLGLKYNIFGIDLSYLISTNNLRDALDNTFRFTISFDFSNMGSKKVSGGNI
jgi:hypothetical protein